MSREIIRVEPLSTFFENFRAPISVVIRTRDRVYVSGLPPFDPATGRVAEASIEVQAEIVLNQLRLCLETAGSSLEKALKCTLYSTSVEKYAAINEIYARYFPKNPPTRTFVCVAGWPGPFDVEIECIAER